MCFTPIDLTGIGNGFSAPGREQRKTIFDVG